MIEIDGSHGEGGGQILRMALALSALTGEETRVTHIRAGRPKPGLARQHLTAIEALSRLTWAKTTGAELGSTAVTFRPSVLQGTSLDLDVGTAGSVTLVLQASLLPALFAPEPTTLRIRGGTDVRWAPPADYTHHVFLPLLAGMGARVALRVDRRGYYPRGGGRVYAEVSPSVSLGPFQGGERGEVQGIAGRAHVSNLPGTVVQRIVEAAREALADFPSLAIEESTYGSREAEGRGGALVLWAETPTTRLGANALAEKGVRAENVGKRAAGELRADLKAGVTLDRYMADQLLPYMALASGPSVFRVREVSRHLRTLFWLLPQFLDVAIRTRSETRRTRVEVTPSRTWRWGAPLRAA